MSDAALLLLLINFGLIGALPRAFFKRDGRLTLMWCVTALPFFLCPVALVASRLGVLGGFLPPDERTLALLSLPAVLLSACSIALIALTVGTHRIPLALWHQENDAPAELVIRGPYAWIRHPFYAAFLLAFLAAVFLFPSPATLITLLYALAFLNHTAAREEKRLANSRFGAEYRAYCRHAGRFCPRPRRVRHA